MTLRLALRNRLLLAIAVGAIAPACGGSTVPTDDQPGNLSAAGAGGCGGADGETTGGGCGGSQGPGGHSATAGSSGSGEVAGDGGSGGAADGAGSGGTQQAGGAGSCGALGGTGGAIPGSGAGSCGLPEGGSGPGGASQGGAGSGGAGSGGAGAGGTPEVQCTTLPEPNPCQQTGDPYVTQICEEVRCYDPQGAACLPVSFVLGMELKAKLKLETGGNFGHCDGVAAGPECGKECCYVVRLVTCLGRPLQIEEVTRVASLTSGVGWAA